jgi:archaellum biogenesis protein FlaJ (TadC family)
MILHLIEEWNYDFDQAIELVKEKHVYANPNIELILNT